jgi:hypothetical protein
MVASMGKHRLAGTRGRIDLPRWGISAVTLEPVTPPQTGLAEPTFPSSRHPSGTPILRMISYICSRLLTKIGLPLGTSAR